MGGGGRRRSGVGVVVEGGKDGGGGGQYPHATVFLPLRNCSSLMGSEDVVSKIKIIIITFMC